MKQPRSSMLIIGAGSDIGQALAKVAAAAGCALLLTARSSSQLHDLKDCLRKHGVEIVIFDFDVLATDTHASFIDSLPFFPDMAVCLVGVLGDQRLAEQRFAEADLILRSNLLGPISVLSLLANRMKQRGHGAIIGVSSPAGDRGRADNYVYGAAKAGLTAFLSGLRQRLGRTPVRVVTIKPGPVCTKMTAGQDNFLMTTPDRIAPALFAACSKARGVVYLPWYWRPITILIRFIPEALFRRLRFNAPSTDIRSIQTHTQLAANARETRGRARD
jgi:decaprenylphospho-beta-D-erythro-pentofuranosid-2-ulose 2-reductase